VLFGTTTYLFQAAGTIESGQWKISDGSDDGADAITVFGDLEVTVSDTGDSARITVGDAETSTTGFADGGSSSPDSGQIVIPIQVRHGSVTLMFNRILTFTKAKGGSAMVLTLIATEQIIPYDKTGALLEPSKQIIFDAGLENIPSSAGDVTWEYRLTPTASWTNVPGTTGITRGQSQNTRLSVTRQALANLMTGGARQISIRATLSNRQDIVSVARVQDGADGIDGPPGQSVVELMIIPRSSFTLFNNTGSVIFDAKLFYKGVAADAAIESYQWFNVVNNAKTDIAGANAAFREFMALPSGSGGRLIGCRVTYDDADSAVTG